MFAKTIKSLGAALETAAAGSDRHKAARLSARRQMPQVRRDPGNVFRLIELAYHLRDCDVLSFDFFDTIAHRSCDLSTIINRTAEFGSRTIPGDHGPIPPAVFIAARGRISDYVKRQDDRDHGRNEILLPELFERSLRPFVRDADRRQAAAAALTDYETRNEIAALTVDPEFLELSCALERHPITPILITDMYLPRAAIDEILAALDIRHVFHKIYVSADVGVTKNSGKLFDVVARDLAIHPARILHIGDNYNNDAFRPRERKWQALHYFNPENELNRRELAEGARARAKDPAWRLASGSRLIAASAATNDLDHLIETVIAPSFLLFTNRCLEFAEASALDRLYFLTRDGTIFQAIAQRLQERLGIFRRGDLDVLHRLDLNRSASMLLTYEGLENFGWAVHAASYLAQRPFSLAALLDAFNLSVDDLEGLSLDDRAKLLEKLDEQDPAIVEAFLAENRPIRTALDGLLCACKARVAAYLDQQGILTTDPIGLIDIGYSGTAAKFISNYLMQDDRLDAFAAARMHCLFFATNRFFRGNLAEMHPGIVLHDGMMLSYERPEDKTAVLNFGWLEPFAVDPELGSLLGYRYEDDRLVSHFAPPHHADARRALRARILAPMDDLINTMLLACPLPLQDCNTIISSRLRRFVKAPTARQVRAVEELAHDFGIIADQKQSVVQRLGLKDVTTSLRQHRARDVWLQGSLRRSNLHWLGPAVELWGRRSF